MIALYSFIQSLLQSHTNMNPILYLQAGYQTYEWGKIGSQSFVYNLLTADIQNNNNLDQQKPYAELWMGTHTNCPSYIKNNLQKVSLLQTIQANPQYYLGNKYGSISNELPFLFKVLSVNKALSIQAHPDKLLAQKLHQQFPNIYKDPNHKPEMCIALTEFEAFCNFAKADEIIENIEQYQELRDLINDENSINQFKNQKDKQSLQILFKKVVNADNENIKEQLNNLLKRIKSKKEHNLRDQLVLRLNNQYPNNDVGIFIQFFLNYLKLQPGQALQMGANEPHAYLSGDCIECMSCSDNVVRAGLTPKFIDKQTLCDMLTYKMKDPDILQERVIFENDQQRVLQYQPSEYDEFACWSIQIEKGDLYQSIKFQNASIFLIVEGSSEIQCENKIQKCNKGDVFFISANKNFMFKNCNNLKIFICYSNV